MTDRGTVIITGAGSGIGRAAAVELSRRGFDLALVGRRSEKLLETIALCHGSAQAIVANLAEPGAAARVVSESLRQPSSSLVGLVNNAGWAPSGTIAQADESTIRDCFLINSVAPTALIAAAWKELANGAARRGRAAVVNVSSVATLDPFPILYAYACAKMSLNMSARFVQSEGAPLNIKGFAVLPGAVETEMLRGLVSEDQLPRSSALPPEAIATVIADCIAGLRDQDAGTNIIVTPSG